MSPKICDVDKEKKISKNVLKIGFLQRVSVEKIFHIAETHGLIGKREVTSEAISKDVYRNIEWPIIIDMHENIETKMNAYNFRKSHFIY